MKILVTGAKGFIGKNLIAELRNRNYQDIFEYDLDTKDELLDEYCKEADFVYNLAGINRPERVEEFMEGNRDFVATLLVTLKKYDNNCPILLTSSVQAELNNPYGLSKRAGEELFLSHGKETGAKVTIYRLPNVFGKWCRPNYNSGVATFCNNIAAGLPIKVNDAEVIINLVYIDDVVDEFIKVLEGCKIKTNKIEKEECQNSNVMEGENHQLEALEDEKKSRLEKSKSQLVNSQDEDRFFSVPVTYKVRLGEIVDSLYSFKADRETLCIPDMSDGFTKKLYATYLSYLPTDGFAYPLKMNEDERGSFTEFIRTKERGQVSVNISKPGITKGNHWHHTKNEKFLVVAGQGVIRFRGINSEDTIEYFVDDKMLQVVDIPPGYTHNIENLGDSDMVTIMWVNEPFDKEKADTHNMQV
jgi:UDP-2-acetamido-2,6-beta-L-arabino-hexul-4-ose reductase